ncbi:MAG: adenylate/guanylate cyclase domain-containing protein [Euzebya sp.]
MNHDGEDAVREHRHAAVAYQVTGAGQVDLLIIPGLISHLELDWADPDDARFYRRLGSFCRLIRMDKRGTGLSDPVSTVPTLEERMHDMLAVLDAAGSQRAFVMGMSEGGPVAALCAATHPDRIAGLILYGTFVNGRELPEEIGQILVRAIEHWGAGHIIDLLGPSQANNEVIRRQIGSYERSAASPGMARGLLEALQHIDVEPILPTIRVPTLVLHRRDEIIPISAARKAAELVPGATFVELEGADHWPTIGDSDAILREIEKFVTGRQPSGYAERALATVLFIDIVGSTALAASLGDSEWRRLLERHDQIVLEAIGNQRGRWIKSLGDGHLAVFDGPAPAISAARAVRDRLSELDLEVRVGVHTGECELTEDDVAGMAVHIAARVNALAEPAEILVTSTIVDLVIGSGLTFVDRGERTLKGVPGRWRLHAVAEDSAPMTVGDRRQLRMQDRALLRLAARAPAVPRTLARIAARFDRTS